MADHQEEVGTVSGCSRFPGTLVAGVGVCLLMAPSAFAGQTGASGAYVTPVKLKVNVDHSSFGAGRGANMRQDIHGEFRVGADHTCGNGSAGASPIPAVSANPAGATPAASTPNRGAPSSAFQMTAGAK